MLLAVPSPAEAAVTRRPTAVTIRFDEAMMPGSPDRFAQDVDHRMALAREWDELVAQVRALDGFGDFLRPPRLETLLPAAEGGPVVILNVSRWRCDALVVTTSGVEVVELRDLKQDDVVAQVQAYLDAVGARQGETERGAVARDADVTVSTDAVEAALDGCLQWMWDAFAAKILEHLGWATTPAGDWPRIWWCPTGPLTLLPIHAAGDHRTPGEAVLDRAVSSYTPTLRALVEARAEAGRHTPGPERMLFVGMPTTPHRANLPNVQVEEHLITQLFGDRCTALVGEQATRGTVLTNLPGHSWVHFACHGEQNLGDPSHGGVVVQDGTLTVTDLSAQQYRGEFAYLSGCKTAVGGVNLPDEAITLAAALHYTGYRHVIATLWSVCDEEAAQVATDVYRAVAPDGVLRADGAARALHHAVRTLRAEKRDRPSVWTPFAHTGP
jgi:CHAT domain